MCSHACLNRFVLRSLMLFFIVTTFLGCNDVKKQHSYTIGFSQCVGSDLWRKTMLDEMNMELSFHPGVNFVYADAENNSSKQISQVRQMLDEGIDLLIISPNEAKPLTGVVEEAYRKGVPVIIVDRKTASSLYTAYVGANNYEIGKMAGQYLGATSKNEINLLEVMGLPGSSPAIERDRGFEDGIKKFTNIHVQYKIYGDWLKEHAISQLLSNKDRLQGINAVFAHNDVMASATRSVINSLHLPQKIRIIGVDALPGTGGGLQMVDDKEIDASLLYPTGGKEAIETAFRILNRQPFQRDNMLQSLVIDSSNVQLMKLQWNKVQRQQQDILRQQALLEEQKSVYKSQQQVLNILVITLVLAIVFGGLAFYWLMENRKINKSLEVKNSEIVSQRNQLIEMSNKAESATEARLNFFTNVSHEFRTPLTLMLSPLEDMLKNDKVASIAGRDIRMIQQNAFRLLKLVNQLIDYRKIQIDKQKIKASENNLVEFLRDIVSEFRDYTQKLHIQLSFVPTEKEIKVWFDVNMMDKVFFNLIHNAIKFTPENGQIKVALHKDESKVYIEIKDNGVGMSDEDASLIFDQFYQADHAPVSGSGIGLSLSKEIVALHQGEISVKSEKWKGTTFTVSLLLGERHVSLIERVFTPGKWSDMSERSKLYQQDLERIIIEKYYEPTIGSKENSILIIEDNPELLNYLVGKFNDYYEVFSAEDGNVGINKAYEKVPDLILSDVVLPGISGKELTKKLKSDMRTSHIPIILLTAQGSTEHQISGMQSMADMYITKPFNFDFLLASVENLLTNRGLLKQHFASDISPTEKLPLHRTLDKKFLNDFAGVVEQNLANDQLNVDDISRELGISRVQLYRKVKALLDCSVTDYVLSRRLKKAKYLLNHEKLTISEITYMVGFSNPNYFATVFKTKYGCTPTEFKKNNVQNA